MPDTTAVPGPFDEFDPANKTTTTAAAATTTTGTGTTGPGPFDEFDPSYQPPATTTSTAPGPYVVPGRQHAGPPDPNALGLSDVGPLIHTALSGVTPLVDLYTSAMNAGPNTWLGLVNVPGATFGERLRNQVAARQQELADFATKHPYASTAANVTGMVAGDIPRAALLGPFAPYEAGAEAGLAAAPHQSVAEDALYTAGGTALSAIPAVIGKQLVRPLSALGSRIMQSVETPVETYLRQMSAPPDAAGKGGGLMWPLVKFAMQSAPAAYGYLKGTGEEALGGLAGSHILERGTKMLEDWWGKRAAASAASAAAPIMAPTAEEWAAHEAQLARMPPSVRGNYLRSLRAPPSILPSRVVPTLLSQFATPPYASDLGAILSENALGPDYQD
jgi:hypothetical protein